MKRRALPRRDQTRLFGFLGVVAIVATGVIGFVSYNALSGLPFQPTYHVSVELPDADRLIATDDVRIGGVRVGQVADVIAEPSRSGARPYALIQLGLDPSIGRLPVDSTVRVRAASVLGATYVDLTLGRSRNTVPAGGTIALAHASSTVAVTDLFQIFNGNAARNFQDAAGNLAAGLAGRGTAVNATIASVAALLPALTNVASALASPSTRLARFLSVFASTADALAPVSPQFAGLVSGGAVTFGALASERSSLAATIEAAPPAESAATIAFQDVQPGLGGLAQLMAQLQPAGRLLPSALATANTTLSVGVAPLLQLPTLTGRLQTALSVLESVSRLQSTGAALRKLADLMAAVERTLAVLTPAQVHCNLIPIFSQALASYFGMLGTGEGPSMQALGIATFGAQGEGQQSNKPAPNLHVDNLPIENATECQSNNEPYNPKTQDLTNPVGLQPDHARQTFPPPGVLQRARSVGLLAPSSPAR
jgi:phospholipid/cholesterol/gamma-HCH transport system substrate-binding protein